MAKIWPPEVEGADGKRWRQPKHPDLLVADKPAAALWNRVTKWSEMTSTRPDDFTLWFALVRSFNAEMLGESLSKIQVGRAARMPPLIPQRFIDEDMLDAFYRRFGLVGDSSVMEPAA